MPIGKIPPKANDYTTSHSDEIVTNESGGKQSRIAAKPSLMPFLAFLEVGKVLKVGAERYAPDNWRLIPSESHLDHALIHVANLQDLIHRQKCEDQTLLVEEASHFACRVMMFLEQFLDELSKES
jgi:hypothetical protein